MLYLYCIAYEVTLAFTQFGKYVYLQKQKYFCIESITLQSLLYSYSTLEEPLPRSSMDCKGMNYEKFQFALEIRKKEARTTEIA